MSQAMSIQGVLFSNEDHNIIFLNKTLQMMLDFPETSISTFVGEPAHSVLGLSSEAYHNLVQQIVTQGQLIDEPIELKKQNGESISTITAGVLNTDDKGKVISIDYTFQAVDEALLTNVSDSLSVDLVQEVVRFYFKRQLEGFYDIMTKIGGKKLGMLLNDVVNTTAQQQNWKVQMDGNTITDDANILRLDTYHGLLNKAASTVKKVVGKSVMQKQVNKVNKKSNPMTFDYIDEDWHEKL